MGRWSVWPVLQGLLLLVKGTTGLLVSSWSSLVIVAVIGARCTAVPKEGCYLRVALGLKLIKEGFIRLVY
eukprot:XP_001704386.1 Hypothetical protein GL50803_111573 [Giardia lamblia ATCC 50803]